MLRLSPILFVLVTQAVAATAYLEPKALGEALGYPADKIRVTDWTETVQKKTPNVLSSFLYEGEAGTFARVAVVVATHRTLLTEKYESEIQESIVKSKDKKLPQAITKITLGNDGYGYAGLDAFGPGGGQNSVLVTLDDAKIDFRITITIPSDPPLDRLQGADSYYELVDGHNLNQKMLEVAIKVAGTYVTGAGADLPEAASPPPLETPQAIPSEPLESTHRDAIKKKTPAPPKPIKNSNLIWPWVVTPLLLILLAWVLIRKKKKP
jgi:hypothetical protein